MNPLKELFLAELADRHDAEKRLVAALPNLIRTATCKHLQELLRSHAKETEGHVKAIEKVFKSFGEKPKSRECEAMVGLIAEAEEIARDFNGSPAVNAAIIGIARKIEHQEMASYGSLHDWAGVMGIKEASAILQGLHGEAKAADDVLVELGRCRSNREAFGEDCSAPGADCGPTPKASPADKKKSAAVAPGSMATRPKSFAI